MHPLISVAALVADIDNPRSLRSLPRSMNAHFFDSAIRQIATTSISGYQKYISPRKGFSCAYRLLYKSESCSHYVKRIVAERGLAAALKASRQRFQDCREANQILRARYNRYTYASQNREEEQERNKLKKNNTHYSNDCSNCSSGDCDAIAACCTTDPGDCGTPDCGDCNTGIDCGTIDCGSGLDCGGADCGSGLDCGTIDCGGCG